MKKFLALLFVCAGLTAMAAAPHVNKAKVTAKADNAMVLKTKTLSNDLMPSFNSHKAGGKTIQQFFIDKKVTPNENGLMRKAPARVAAEDVMATKIASMLAYTYDTATQTVVQAKEFLYGGWDAELEQVSDNQFNAYIFFTSIPFVIDVDYEAKTCEMEVGQLAEFSGSGDEQDGNNIITHDTVETLYLFNENYFFSEDETPTSIQGEMMNDGTMYFQDGWVVYVEMLLTNTTKRNGNVVSVTHDTIAGWYTDFMRGTYLLTANANHEYTSSSTGNTSNNNVYMFQYEDTAYVFNLWQMGNRMIEFYLNEDHTMAFPSDQIVYTEDVSSYEAQYPQFDWSVSHMFFNFAVEVDENGNVVEDSESEDDMMGTFDKDGIYWPASAIYDLYGRNGGYYLGLGFYPFLNNKVTFTNGNWLMMGTTADPVINTELTDEAVIITLELEENAEYLMMVGDEYVESPCTIARTDEDQVVTVYAIAQVPGKYSSEVVSLEVTIPALEGGDDYLRGDVDDDGSVGIGDVSALIDYLLNHDASQVNIKAADCDEDESVGIGDVSALIDYLLSHHW